MKAYLRVGDAVAPVYWLKRSARGIVGWYTAPSFSTILGLPGHSSVDFHFTYPPDGAFHTSQKYVFDGPPRIQIFRNVYRDRVRTKVINLTTGERHVEESVRGESEDAIANMTPRHELPPLVAFADKQPFYPFATSAIPVPQPVINSALGFQPLSSTRIEDDDLLLDNDIGKGVFNVFGFLSSPSFVLKPIGTPVGNRVDRSGVPLVGLTATFHPSAA